MLIPLRIAVLAGAVLAGAALHAAAPVAAWAAGGLLLAVGAVSLAARRPEPTRPPRRPAPPGPPPVTESTCGPAVRLLESAVVHAHDAVVILEAHPNRGPGRSVIYANDAFCRMTGYARPEVIGRSLHFLRGPGSDPDTLDRIRAALANNDPLRIELRNYRKDGTPFWVDLSLVPVPDLAGRPAHWVMIQRDITDRKRAEDALRHSEALFRGIFEGAEAGVSLTDARGRFVSCNPAFAAMIGRTVEEVLALDPADITHPDDWAGQIPLFDEVKAGARDRFHYSKRYLRPDGQVVWVELSFAAIRNPAGEYEYGLGVSLNVTEKHLLEEHLRQTQKMDVIGQMAGGVAHDFNNLLTAVLGNLALVRLPEGDPNRPLLAAVEQAAVRAADLTGKLLGYARRNQLVFSPVEPREALGEVVGLLRRTLDPRIRLSVLVADDAVPVRADPTLLTQALMNLCLNARDAMPEGGSLVLAADNVEVTAEDASRRPGEARPGPYVRLSVADTGCGITDEVKARLFEPFFTTKETGKGTGLGLPMVHGIVRQHGGWVTCTSAPGCGARFDLYLPPLDPAAVARPGPRPPADVSQTPLPIPVPASLAAAADDRITILMVDDEPMIRELGRATLERAGFRVLTADDGVEAVEVFGRQHPRVALVILDVTMPRMSGRDAFRLMVDINPAARILFSTGYSSEDISELGGAVGLLSKPYRPQELLAAVEAALAPEPAPAG